MTYDPWFGVNLLSKLQLSNFHGLTFIVFSRFGGKGSLNKLINDKAVCRTAPATQGLFIKIKINLI